MIHQVVLSYLARLPKPPKGLLDSIYEWAKPYHVQNIKALSSRSSKPVVARKTFKVPSLDYAKLNKSKLEVLILPKPHQDKEGEYNPNTNRITIYAPKLLPETRKNLSSDKIEVLCQDLFTFLYHELIHFLQYNTEEQVGGQLVFHKDFDSFKEDYYTSPVEYKPQLLNALNEYRQSNLSLSDFLEQNDFLKALKSRSSVKYNRALKELYQLTLE